MILFVLFILVLFFYGWFSYILTDPNLVLTSNPIYWNFQLNIWDKFYHNSQFITASYIFIIISLFVLYALIVLKLKKKKTFFKASFKSMHLWLYAAILLPLFLSYNALSHDVYNYMFNAKMAIKYGVNPHTTQALTFVGKDEWVRFMHNIESMTPYGYGWTTLSFIPYVLGMEKFIITLLLYKIFTIIGVVILYFGIQHLSETINNRKLYLYELALLFLNPLFLLEAVSNFHNDFWMMVPAVWSLSMIIRFMKPNMFKKTVKYKVLYFIVASLLLFISISIKIATVLLVPIFVFAFAYVFFMKDYANLIKKKFKLPIPSNFISAGLIFITHWIEKYIPTVVAIVLFIPFFTPRSRYFLPWYMLWVIVWIPFIKNKIIRNTIIMFTLSSMLRYVPWLNNSFEYSAEILQQQRLVTWLIPIVYLFTNIKRATKNIKKLGRM